MPPSWSSLMPRSRGLLSLSLLCSWLCAACPRTIVWLGAADVDAGGQPHAAPAQPGSPDSGMELRRPDAGSPAAAGAFAPVANGGGGVEGSSLAGASGTIAGPGVVQPSADADADGGVVAQAPPPPERKPTELPTATTTCPTLHGSGTYTFGDPKQRTLSAQVYVAPDAQQTPGAGGPLVVYFHGIGSDPSEVLSAIGQSAIDSVVARGGVVAAFTAKICVSCQLPEDVGWYDDDDAVTDHLVACAIRQAHIDTRHIHAVGFSAGALHVLHMALARSNYIASVVSFSGGLYGMPQAPQDADNRVASLLTYGKRGVDVAGVDFADLSLSWYDTFGPKGYYSMLCDQGGGHMIAADVVPHVLRFLQDHPYRISPEPYAAAIPGEFPAYCRNTPKSP
jgi:predicted esterase